ncbi:hypothetical protein HPP92_026791 [Vanilla planifolia]|uniref:Uncharacterized protein n=1 Tax=Vanilla planifolia TaxID=51239 RepID=A0A835PFV0_VANPL|nr:hypothetical protein HPP92_026791 [Vanilla planifolia]
MLLNALFIMQILIVRLTNINGSTVNPPTVVETSIVLTVGNNQPSVPRLKELAKNVKILPQEILVLNHTIFGRVKQIHLSSFLQHSLSSGTGISFSPSLAPQQFRPSSPPSFHHQHHGHHLEEHCTSQRLVHSN